MCLILLALGVSANLPLVVAANRDELYARPTAPAQWWDEPCRWLGGRDLEGGGTWLGVSASGRFAAVTNVRGGSRGSLSRGHLVLQALCAGEPSLQGDFSDFNLLWGTAAELWYAERGRDPVRVEPGYHGLSNARLDTPWPKLTRGLEAMRRSLEPEELFAALGDRAQDATGPLSAAWVETPEYGTRSSTVVVFGRQAIWLEERSPEGSRAFTFRP